MYAIYEVCYVMEKKRNSQFSVKEEDPLPQSHPYPDHLPSLQILPPLTSLPCPAHLSLFPHRFFTQGWEELSKLSLVLWKLFLSLLVAQEKRKKEKHRW